MKTVFEIRAIIRKSQPKSAWGKGVKAYALELIAELIEGAVRNGLHQRGYEFYGSSADVKAMLNGADNWEMYSEGGCSLVYDRDIAKRLCTESELKKFKGGEKDPVGVTWIELQAKALREASYLICEIAKRR